MNIRVAVQNACGNGEPFDIKSGNVPLAMALEGLSYLMYKFGDSRAKILELNGERVVIEAATPVDFGLAAPLTYVQSSCGWFRYVFTADPEASTVEYFGRFTQCACAFAVTYPESCSDQVNREMHEHLREAAV